MATTKNFTVINYIPGTVKGKPVLKQKKESFETAASAEELVEKLQKSNATKFEFIDSKNNLKFLFTKPLHSKNYSKKQLKM